MNLNTTKSYYPICPEERGFSKWYGGGRKGGAGDVLNLTCQRQTIGPSYQRRREEASTCAEEAGGNPKKGTLSGRRGSELSKP